MARFDRDTLKPLLEAQRFPCISIYLPIIREGNSVVQTPIRLRTLLRQAEDYLKTENLPFPQIEKVLEPATDLLEQSLFWSFAQSGLAILLCPDTALIVELKQTVPELFAIQDHFTIRPLLEQDQDDAHYLLLAIGRGGVQLYRGSRAHLSPQPVTDLPESLEHVIESYVFEKQRNQYGGATTSNHGAGAGTVNHGYDNRKDRDRMYVETYCRQVDTQIVDQLQQENLPLVVACVDNLFAIYRKVSKYPKLLDRHLSGSPDHFSECELLEKAWELVASSRPKPETVAWADAQNLLGSDKVRQQIRQIIEAADRGRVARLFLPRGKILPGRYDLTTRQIVWPDLQNDNRPFALDDLYEFAALRTLAAGGEILAVPADWIAEGTDALAVLRY